MSTQGGDLSLILPLITLVVGAVLGFLTSAWMERSRQRHDVVVKILEQYFKIREQICDEIGELAHLQIGSPLDDQSLITKRDTISKLFYKYYDFLPAEVLQEMNCLYACLTDKRNRIFRCKDNRLLPLQDSEIESFVESISLVDNFKYYALVPLNSSDANIRRGASVNYQARSVLRAINESFSLDSLMGWVKKLPK
jgi:hypothetical protein